MAPEYNEPDAMRAYLIQAGVPADRVVADYAGFDTYDSCVRARQIFGVTELVMVTQSYHLPRAVATCLRVGVQTVGVGDDTARQHRRAWQRGAIRDQIACVKTVIDLVDEPRPDPGPARDQRRRRAGSVEILSRSLGNTARLRLRCNGVSMYQRKRRSSA